MTRETKAQRREREEAEREAYLEELEALRKETYPDQLLTLLERACKANFEITASNGMLQVADQDDRRDYVVLPINYINAWCADRLAGLERLIRDKEYIKQEDERKYQLRQSALAKLSEEERKELGL